jgi:hypothetical protein
VLTEQLFDFILGRGERQVADVKFLQDLISSCRCSGLTKHSESAAISTRSIALQMGPDSKNEPEPDSPTFGDMNGARSALAVSTRSPPRAQNYENRESFGAGTIAGSCNSLALQGFSAANPTMGRPSGA